MAVQTIETKTTEEFLGKVLSDTSRECPPASGPAPSAAQLLHKFGDATTDRMVADGLQTTIVPYPSRFRKPLYFRSFIRLDAGGPILRQDR